MRDPCFPAVFVMSQARDGVSGSLTPLLARKQQGLILGPERKERGKELGRAGGYGGEKTLERVTEGESFQQKNLFCRGAQILGAAQVSVLSRVPQRLLIGP